MWKASICPLVVILYVSIFFSIFPTSCTVHAVDLESDQDMLPVTGKLRLVGNEPFTHLVVTTEDGKHYLIEGDLEKELRSYQNHSVTVTGEGLPPKGEFKYRIEVKEYRVIDRPQ